jgi:hypothetical protein
MMPSRAEVQDRFAFGELDVAHAVAVQSLTSETGPRDALAASLRLMPIPGRKEGWLVGPLAARFAILGPRPGDGAWEGWFLDQSTSVVRRVTETDEMVRAWQEVRLRFLASALQPPWIPAEALRLLRHVAIKPGPGLSGEMVRCGYPTAWHRILWDGFAPFEEDF